MNKQNTKELKLAAKEEMKFVAIALLILSPFIILAFILAHI